MEIKKYYGDYRKPKEFFCGCREIYEINNHYPRIFPLYFILDT